jgi:hypothetical protein
LVPWSAIANCRTVLPSLRQQLCQRANGNVKNALKIHEREVPYVRERDVYFRLQNLEIHEIEGHNVPQFLGFDDERFAIEMSIVVRPFLLDFGGA